LGLYSVAYILAALSVLFGSVARKSKVMLSCFVTCDFPAKENNRPTARQMSVLFIV